MVNVWYTMCGKMVALLRVFEGCAGGYAEDRLVARGGEVVGICVCFVALRVRCSKTPEACGP